MKITNRDIGNAMDKEALINLITAIDIEVLRNYRLAVGRSTREIVRQLRPDQLKRKVDGS